MMTRITRRRLLGGAVASAGTYALLGGPAILTSRGQAAAGGKFTQGVASSMPGDDSINLWARVDDLRGEQRVDLEVMDDNESIVFRDSVPVEDNGIVKTRVDEGLDRGKEYTYRFSTGEDGDDGSFRTARGDSDEEPIKIAFFSCQEFPVGFYYAHRDLAKMDVDIVVCLGDYVYETADRDSVPGREDPTGTEGEVQTLDEYRDKYNFYHSDDDLIAVRRKFPLIAIWDDHEIKNDYAAMVPGSATRNRRATNRDRMADGYRAFFEYMPQTSFDGVRNRIYGSIPLGGNAELFLLDTRQFRTNQVCAPGGELPTLPGCPPSEYNRPGRTLLGDRQRNWLKQALSDSEAKWKIVGNQVMIMSLDQPEGQPLNTDGWDGYGDERRDLIDHIAGEGGGRGVENVTFLTGDIHTFFAGDVTRSGRFTPFLPGNPDEPPETGDPTPQATEFVGGSVTSTGLFDPLSDDERVRDVADAIAKRELNLTNPHIKLADQTYKGYGILTARSDKLEVEFRRVCAVRDPDNDTVDTLAKFEVEDGVPSVCTKDDRSELPACPSGPGPGTCPP